MGKIILEFDGVLTDVQKEAPSFLRIFKEHIKKLYDYPIPFEKVWNRVEDNVRRYPYNLAWKDDGKISVRGNADPYILAGVVADMILRESMTDPAERAQYIHGKYQDSKSLAVFREGAKELLEGLVKHNEIAIVTDSRTANVMSKLKTLAPRLNNRLIQVIGSTNKFSLDDNWQEISQKIPQKIPEVTYPQGLQGPVSLRRKEYYDILVKVAEDHNNIPDLTVVGHIYELDLALPDFLGAGIILVEHNHTLECERQYMKESGGKVIKRLDQLLL